MLLNYPNYYWHFSAPQRVAWSCFRGMRHVINITLYRCQSCDRQVTWQHCDRSCDNIVTGHVTTLWQIMWQHCDRSCDNIVTGQWQHQDKPHDNIVTDHVKTLWQVMWQQCGRSGTTPWHSCDNIVTCHVTTLWQAMWQHCERWGDVTIWWQVRGNKCNRSCDTSWQTKEHHDRPYDSIMTKHHDRFVAWKITMTWVSKTHTINLLHRILHGV